MPYFPAQPTCPASLAWTALPTCPTPQASVQPPADNPLLALAPSVPMVVALIGLEILARHAARRLHGWYYGPAAPQDPAPPAIFAPPGAGPAPRP